MDFVAELSQHYAEEMELEKLLEHVNEAWENSPGYMGIVNMKEWRQEGRLNKYEEESRMILESLKNEYRCSVQV